MKCGETYRFISIVFGEMRLNIFRLSNMVETQRIWKNTNIFTENTISNCVVDAYNRDGSIKQKRGVTGVIY